MVAMVLLLVMVTMQKNTMDSSSRVWPLVHQIPQSSHKHRQLQLQQQQQPLQLTWMMTFHAVRACHHKRAHPGG